jgi:hypothetical protein
MMTSITPSLSSFRGSMPSIGSRRHENGMKRLWGSCSDMWPGASCFCSPRSPAARSEDG